MKPFAAIICTERAEVPLATKGQSKLPIAKTLRAATDQTKAQSPSQERKTRFSEASLLHDDVSSPTNSGWCQY
jgi:hypothetical protein